MSTRSGQGSLKTELARIIEMELKSPLRSHRKEVAASVRGHDPAKAELPPTFVAGVHASSETIGCGRTKGDRGSIFGGDALLLKFFEREPIWIFLTSRVIRGLLLGMGTARDKEHQTAIAATWPVLEKNSHSISCPGEGQIGSPHQTPNSCLS